MDCVQVSLPGLKDFSEDLVAGVTVELRLDGPGSWCEKGANYSCPKDFARCKVYQRTEAVWRIEIPAGEKLTDNVLLRLLADTKHDRRSLAALKESIASVLFGIAPLISFALRRITCPVGKKEPGAAKVFQGREPGQHFSPPKPPKPRKPPACKSEKLVSKSAAARTAGPRAKSRGATHLPCTQCGITKPVEDFYSSGAAWTEKCRVCWRKRYLRAA